MHVQTYTCATDAFFISSAVSAGLCGLKGESWLPEEVLCFELPAMETMMDPMEIRFSQENIGEHFRDGTSIFETYRQIVQGMEKREVDMIHVVQRGGHYITIDNCRVAV